MTLQRMSPWRMGALTRQSCLVFASIYSTVFKYCCFFSIFCKNAVLNIRLYLKRFYTSEGWKNHGNRLNLFLLKSATKKLNQHANE